MNYLYSESSTGKKTITLDFSEEIAPVVVGESHPKFDKINDIRMNGTLGDAPESEIRDILRYNSLNAWETEQSSAESVFRMSQIDGMNIDPDIASGLKKILNGYSPNKDEHIQAVLNFVELAEQNSSGIDITEFLRWAMKNGIHLTPDGMVVGYKSLLYVSPNNYDLYFRPGKMSNGDEPRGTAFDILPYDVDIFRPAHRGPGITDGQEWEGYIPMYVGATVEMPRDIVDSDGSTKCSVGLHVGTYEYAEQFNAHRSDNSMALVLVDPRDIVSVPDYAFDKYRVCRYKMIAQDLPGVLDPGMYIPDSYIPEVGSNDDPEPIAGFESDFVPEKKSGSVISALLRILKKVSS